ncbi:hypothetical protein CIB95_04005 [Lottiidibacillus patelloidae]|uniref:Sporulation inhibitor of replication protein SirA n=1 Tax=Lottiidibacillus patelloidae TaxID=2670334 RepID=A0A263BUW9_9BACI|nr:sporulation inhibitor of replication protein SirA [Lottiidibacillus patelloidae]OZM57543.1 hypothetical protein CIB95_04005 [Lottiidibacillus patelloidae]
MRRYHIYLIKEEFAEHFFGQEHKLFDLFSEARISSPHSEVAKRQSSFVIGKIDTISVNHLIMKNLKRKSDYSVLGNAHVLYGDAPKNFAKCTVKENVIELEASGSFEAETTFFETLRKHTSFFLAMDYEHERYGWLNPIKQRTYM